MATLPAGDAVLSVAELTRQIKESLSRGFSAVWVRGEISGFKRADSGHLYFSLKDSEALIDGVMWRTTAARLAFEPRDGVEVEAFGSVTVYEKRGRYQLVCESLRPAGVGALLLALEELKRRLQAEGLFDAARKVALPRFPRRVGLVTSPVGAAVRDLVHVLRRRWPAIGIVLAPVRVQGKGAAEEIAAAVEAMNRLGGVDVLIVGRGGGSLEDLWAFNEEPVVRAVADSRIPVVSAVGHEVDWTLSDLAADVRAPTPSAAAELVVPERREVARRVEGLAHRARLALDSSLAARRRRLEAVLSRYGFQRPRDYLGLVQQRVDDLAERMGRRVREALDRARARLAGALAGYGLRAPRDAWLEPRRQRLGALADRLRALGPQAVLERGYCLARLPDGSLVRQARTLGVGDLLALQFASGEADARVERVRAEETDGG
jgi:exodeoxyribonuclease VII large subunit